MKTVGIHVLQVKPRLESSTSSREKGSELLIEKKEKLF